MNKFRNSMFALILIAIGSFAIGVATAGCVNSDIVKSKLPYDKNHQDKLFISNAILINEHGLGEPCKDGVFYAKNRTALYLPDIDY